MARKRLVSPKLFLHSALYEAEHESGLPVRLAYIGLFTQADKRGIFKWTRDLKPVVLPYDSCDFIKVLEALERHGFVRRYVVDGKAYGKIPTFKEHQTFHHAEKDDPHLPDEPENHGNDAPNLGPALGNTESSPSVAVAVTGAVTTSVAGTSPTTTTVPAPRKPRAPRVNKGVGQDVSWLVPAQLVWERRRGAGTFPRGEAAKRLRPLLDAGWEMDEICDRLDWYLLNKGMEIVLEDAEEAAKRFFNPSITMFWKGFALFDPKAASNSTPPSWATELASTWAECGLGLVSPWRLQHDLHNAYVSCFTPEDGVPYETVLETGRARGRAVLRAAIIEHASRSPRGGWKDFVRALPSHLELRGVKLAEAA